MRIFIWLAILFCVSQSATLSGLNLAYFNVSKLRLEMEVEQGSRKAEKVLKLRRDANFLLVTILWANVSVNVLLPLLTGSVLSGVMAFFFSTVVITIVGEIIPQSYFSRHAIEVGAKFSPLLRFYQVLLYPVAKPTALVLDRWLGREAISYFQEDDIREMINLHMQAEDTEIEKVEGRGVINLLALDDLPAAAEGEALDPDSIIEIEYSDGSPIFPRIEPEADDPFLKKLHRSERKWAVLVDSEKREPRLAVNVDKFIREALFQPESFHPHHHCHKPILIRDESTTLGEIIPEFKVNPRHSEDDVVDRDIILVWGDEKKVITGADLLGRLLRGIVRNVEIPRRV